MGFIRKYFYSVLPQAAWHFLLANVLFKLLRIPFFISWLQNNSNFVPADVLISFAQMWYFDLPPVGYFFLPVWILHIIGSRLFKLNHSLFIFSTLLVCVLFLIDTLYYPFNGRHLNFGFFQLLNDPGNSIIHYIVSYWFYALAIIVLVYFLFKFNTIGNFTIYYSSNKTNRLVKNSLLCILYSSMLFLSIRGGLQNRPLRSIDIAKYASPKTISLINTAPFEIISTIDRKPELQPIYGNTNALPFYFSLNDKTSTAPLNICLIIVESMSMEYVQMKKPVLTPFLNSLANKSTVFTHCFANGRKSKEMAPSIFASIAQLYSDDYISTPYSQNNLQGAFNFLNKNGYHSSFFHGGANGTMEFQSFFKQIGLNNYYGRNEYPINQHYDGAWGIYDRPYLQYWAQQIDKLPKPFFTSVFTLSSHHPYSIEKQFTSLSKLPYENSQSIRYTDSALAQFFATASTKPWFKNTLFIITADHTSVSHNDFYSQGIGKFWIPFLMYNPQNLQAQIVDTTVAHTNIMPIAMRIAGLGGKYKGANAWQADIGNMAILRNDGFYTCIAYPYLLNMSLEGKVIEYFKLDKNNVKQNLATDKRSEQMLKNMQNYIAQNFFKTLNNSWN